MIILLICSAGHTTSLGLLIPTLATPTQIALFSDSARTRLNEIQVQKYKLNGMGDWGDWETHREKINETSRFASRALDFVLCFAFWQTRKNKDEIKQN